MIVLKVFIIVMLMSLWNNTEGFQSKAEIRQKATELHDNRDLFIPNVKYGKVKKKISWIDPVVFDDTYKLHLEKEPTISDLENIFS